MKITPDPAVIHRAGPDSVDYIPADDVQPGTVVPFGPGLGVTKSFIPAGHLGTLHLEGQFDFPKVAASAYSWGDALMWDPNQAAADGNNGAMIASKNGVVHAYCTSPAGAAAGDQKVRALLI
jgi:predicted RecA/RadA family phage recombinase